MLNRIISQLILVLFVLPNFMQAQQKHKTVGTVDRVLNIPVFMFAYPTDNYEEVGTLSAIGSMLSVGTGEEGVNVQEMTRELVFVAKRKMQKGKVPEFDAIIVNPDNYSGILIKFEDRPTRESEVVRVLNVPIFMYAYPNSDYDEVDQVWGFGAELPLGTNMTNSLSYVIGRGKRRAAKGKISEFDGIILNPNDGSYILIKFRPDSL